VHSDGITDVPVAPGFCSTSTDRAQANLWHSEPDEDDSRDWISPVSPPEEEWYLNPNDIFAQLTSAQMQAARKQLTTRLRNYASRLGISDGCIFLTVEPAVFHADNGTQYRQHIWWGHLLAPIPAKCADPELWDELARATMYPTGYRRDERKLLTTDTPRHLLREILGWPSLCLFDSWQWWHYHVQTWRRPLYCPFGSWRQLLAEPEKHDSFAQQLPRVIALRHGNRLRRQTAAVQFDRLVAVARPLWRQLQENAGPRRRGRPAHRSHLKEKLNQAGIQISDWQLRRLMKELGKSEKGDGQ
jgi:hypothetical protein